MKAKVTIIAAVDSNGAIGLRNQLLFHLPEDMKRFKQLTTGHTIIMGRHTFESLPKGALPNRRNIVLTTHKDTTYPGAETYSSLSEALGSCSSDEEVFVIGGAEVYRQSIDRADELCLTEVQTAAPSADVYFPIVDKSVWHEKERVSHPADERHAYPYDFVTYIR